MIMKLFVTVVLLAASFTAAEKIPFSFFLDQSEEPVFTNNFHDEKICLEMVKSKKCVTDRADMEKLCKKACMDAAPFYKSKYIDDDDTYFGLRAKRWDGTTLNFDRFDGYITAIVNLPLTCKKKDEAKFIADFHEFRRIVPSGVEFVVFPYEMDGYEKGDDCIDFVKEVSRGRTNIHVMKPIAIRGESIHPVYEFMMDATAYTHTAQVTETLRANSDMGARAVQVRGGSDSRVMREDVGTVFFISPGGTQIDKLEYLTIAKYKRYMNDMKSWEF